MFAYWLNALVPAWESYYANHPMVRTFVAFAHVAPLIAGAGFAVTTDSEVLQATHRDHERLLGARAHRHRHSVVLVSLIVTIISGVLLFASDADAFLHSSFFWTKMALVGLLIVNGAFLRYADKRAIHNPDDLRWRPIRVAATVSMILWFVTTFIGVALPNVG
jgi:uncharacterized membrane protein